MNKNIILFIILIALTVFTYFFEEIGHQEREHAKEQAITLYNQEDLGELSAIKFSKYSLDLASMRIGENKLPIEKAKLDEFFHYLSSLKVKREIYPEEIHEKMFNEDSSSLHFTFSKGSLTFVLGNKLGFSRDFYIKVLNSTTKESEKVVVAFSDLDQEGVYTKEQDESLDLNYRKFLAIFNLKEEYFHDLRVFKNKKEIINAHIKTFRSPKFGLIKGAPFIEPRPYQGVSVQVERLEIFFKQLQALRGISLYRPFKYENLTKLLIDLDVTDLDKSHLEFKIFSRMGSLEGFFLWGKHLDYVMELTKEQVQFLFYPSQYYWNKKLFNSFKDFPSNQVELTFLKNNKSINLKFFAGHNFRVESKAPLSNLSTRDLLLYLVNEADFISYFDKIDEKAFKDGSLLKKDALRLKIADKQYYFTYQKPELLLIDPIGKMKFHFLGITENIFKNQYKDYLKEK